MPNEWTIIHWGSYLFLDSVSILLKKNSSASTSKELPPAGRYVLMSLASSIFTSMILGSSLVLLMHVLQYSFLSFHFVKKKKKIRNTPNFVRDDSGVETHGRLTNVPTRQLNCKCYNFLCYIRLHVDIIV